MYCCVLILCIACILEMNASPIAQSVRLVPKSDSLTESPTCPMHPSMYLQSAGLLQNVSGFKESNGHTYEAYLANWRHRNGPAAPVPFPASVYTGSGKATGKELQEVCSKPVKPISLVCINLAVFSFCRMKMLCSHLRIKRKRRIVVPSHEGERQKRRKSKNTGDWETLSPKTKNRYLFDCPSPDPLIKKLQEDVMLRENTRKLKIVM